LDKEPGTRNQDSRLNTFKTLKTFKTIRTSNDYDTICIFCNL
jgi:hypothetical protein